MSHSQVFWQHSLILKQARVSHVNFIRSCKLSNLIISCVFFLSTAHLRVVCDALNIVLLFDDYSDTQTPEIVPEVADNILDALYDPYAPPPNREI